MRSKHSLLYLLVFSAGFASMSVELAAVRALAPYFGASVFVWTNVLGIILASLSLGYFVAGKLADRWSDPRSLAKAVLAGGGLAVLAPYLAQLLARAFIPADLRLEDSFTIFWGGSLAVGFLAFAPAAFLLSFTSPAAIRFLAAEKPVGEVSGRIFALSTVGSILGTFLTTYWLVPSLGTRFTFAFAGAAVLLPALGLLFCKSGSDSARGGSLRGLGLALLPWLLSAVAGAAFVGRPMRDWGWGELIQERETPYQFMQLREKGKQRWLQVGEGLDSYQSMWVEGELLTGGYFDLFLLAPALAEIPKEAPLRVCILGLGGGTASRLFQMHEGFRRRMEIDGVEIDEGLVELAREPFGLDANAQPNLRVISGIDARAFLSHARKRYDVVLLDTYAAQFHIPFHLASKEFFELVNERLEQGGVLAINVGMFRAPRGTIDRDPTVHALATTAAEVFGDLTGVLVRGTRNAVLFARKGRPLPSFSTIYQDAPSPYLRRLAGEAALPGMAHHWSKFATTGERLVLTDDCSPLDRIQIRSFALDAKGSSR